MNFKRVWQDGNAVLRAWWYLRQADVLGERARVWGHPIITKNGILEVGTRLRLVATVARTELAIGPEGHLVIGDEVFINYGSSIAAQQRVEIGNHCSLGTYVLIMDNDFHQVDPELRNVLPAAQPIILEDNVWLGARVIVLKGVRIGRDSVIGAGSVVTRDIPPYSVAAGVPARVIRAVK